jgi:hypothetical protein
LTFLENRSPGDRFDFDNFSNLKLTIKKLISGVRKMAMLDVSGASQFCKKRTI